MRAHSFSDKEGKTRSESSIREDEGFQTRRVACRHDPVSIQVVNFKALISETGLLNPSK